MFFELRGDIDILVIKAGARAPPPEVQLDLRQTFQFRVREELVNLVPFDPSELLAEQHLDVEGHRREASGVQL